MRTRIALVQNDDGTWADEPYMDLQHDGPISPETLAALRKIGKVAGDLLIADATPREPAQFPAAVLVHWPSGPVACCVPHADALLGLGQFLGSHTVASPLPITDVGFVECVNCVNEGPPDA